MDMITADFNNAQWLTADESDLFDFAPVTVQDGGAIRTIHGILDFGHGLAEMLEEELRDVEELGRERRDEKDMPPWMRDLRHLPKVIEVRSIPRPARKFQTVTYVLNAGGEPTPIDLHIADRVRSVVTNAGATNPAYVGSESGDVSIGSQQFNWAILPTSGPAQQREIRALGRIWAFSPLGTSVDVVTEYGHALDPIASGRG